MHISTAFLNQRQAKSKKRQNLVSGRGLNFTYLCFQAKRVLLLKMHITLQQSFSQIPVFQRLSRYAIMLQLLFWVCQYFGLSQNSPAVPCALLTLQGFDSLNWELKAQCFCYLLKMRNIGKRIKKAGSKRTLVLCLCCLMVPSLPLVSNHGKKKLLMIQDTHSTSEQL